jgi:hypothetical protein
LLDEPVNVDKYCAATTADYGPKGHFLDRVIIHKVIGNRLWRFDSNQDSFYLEYFKDGRRGVEILEGEAASQIARKFSMNENILRRALAIIES